MALAVADVAAALFDALAPVIEIQLGQLYIAAAEADPSPATSTAMSTSPPASPTGYATEFTTTPPEPYVTPGAPNTSDVASSHGQPTRAPTQPSTQAPIPPAPTPSPAEPLGTESGYSGGGLSGEVPS